MTQVLLAKRFQAQPKHLKCIRDTISETLKQQGFEQNLLDDTVLAVDEACQNIIRHAYSFDQQGIIDLILLLNNNELSAELVDYAKAVDPRCCEPKGCSRPLTPGGLGTLIMNQVMDSVAYECPPPLGVGNKLIMRRRLGQ
ncbi:MAG: ATP-binding protein [Gammaproteobacteria bacterium]|nr:ATP-binding protein [Gammaproteobacteria bacterium]NVK87263.1 ATP-binding protein [Gammaproteobacteria bacterium]